MTNKSNMGQAGPAAMAAAKGLARLWCSCWSCYDLPPAAFLSPVLFAGCLEGGDSLVNSTAPGSPVSSESRPLAAVYMTNSEGLPQRVFVSFLWCTSVAVAGGDFAIQGYLRQSMVLHSGDVPCLAGTVTVRSIGRRFFLEVYHWSLPHQ